MSRVLVRLGLALVSLLVSASLAEMLCHWRDVGPRYAMDQYGCQGMVVRLDPQLLFRVVPSSSRPDINRQGFREREFTAKGSQKRLLVIGDSFVMGNNVAPEETLPRQLQSLLPGWEVLNLGVLGYGPDQELLRLRQDGLRLNPDAVLVCLYPANDFHDLAKNRQANVAGWLRWRLPLLVRKLFTGRFLPAEQEDELVALLLRDKPTPVETDEVPLMRAALQGFQQALAGVPWAVVIIPAWENMEGDWRSHRDPFANEKQAEALCAELKIPYVSLREGFIGVPGLFDLHDRHLSVEGNRRAAELIRSAFMKMTSQYRRFMISSSQ